EVALEVTVADETTRARFRIDREGAVLRALVQPQTGASIERQLGIDADTEIGFTSPLAQFVTASRLRLRPGERRDVNLVRFAAPTLLPELVRLRYQRLPDVELATQAGPITASDNLIESLAAPALEIRFQANLLGLPVRMRQQTPDCILQYLLGE